MTKRITANKIAGRLLSGAAITAIMATGAMAQSISDEIVVTAQRTEQSLQDVPIAVSAFGGEELQDRQIESFTDIQFSIPNFAFTRTQFTGSTIAIRGIGGLAVGASTEASTSIHMNEVFIAAPRLFETEFYDIERVEILRGPQGTLFGRNATGGVVNVITAKANPDQIEGYVDAEYGNFDSVKVHGALNVPITDTLAARPAGPTIQRDGFTENVFLGTDIDDRNIYSLRGSVRWLPSDNTTIDFTANYMREDDNRARYQKQVCADGPRKALLGCEPGVARDVNSVQDLRATFFANASAEALGLAAGDPAAGAFGLYSITQPQVGLPQPTDLRQVAQDFVPKYDSEESIFLVNAKHDFETFSVKLNAGWGNSKIATRTDFDGGVGPVLTLPAAIQTLPALANIYAGGLFPVSDFDVGIEGPNNGLTGIIGGFTQSPSNRYQAFDLSIGETEYWTVEGIVTTDFDSRINFLGGVNYTETNGFADYAVSTTGLDYFSLVLGTLSAQAAFADAAATTVLTGGGSLLDAQNAALAAAAQAANTGYSFYVPYFFNDSDDVFLESLSFFGEAYVDISDTLKFTAGVRHNRDTKGSREREALIASIGSATAPIVPLGTPSVRGLLDPNELVQGTAGAATPSTDFRVIEGDFNATTGRAVLQWTPSNNAQYYLSYTRGYKPGGFNPRTNSALISDRFEEETINAFEIGAKTNLFDGLLQANLTGFYYDYSGLQVSRIVANSSVNDNIDATVFGVEGEFVLRPTDRLTLNMNAAYLNTEIGNFATIDVRNPDPRNEGVLLADITNGSNCVLDLNGAPNIINPAVTLASINGTLAGAAPELAAGFDALTAAPFSACGPLQGVLNDAVLPLGPMGALISLNQALGTDYQVIGGFETDATGNQLPGSPEFQIAGGIQYEMAMGDSYTLTPRLDAYYQTKMYTNIFNTDADLVDGYAYLNGQVRFAPTDGNWHVRFFMQNITDEDAITGQYDVGQGAGNFTNLFIIEPRRWGVGFGMTF